MMSFRPYHSAILIPAGQDISDLLAKAAAYLTKSGRRIQVEAQVLVLDGYRFTLEVVQSPEERQDLIRLVLSKVTAPDHFSQVVLMSGDPDPNMDFFNDAVFLWEFFEAEFRGAILYDIQAAHPI